MVRRVSLELRLARSIGIGPSPPATARRRGSLPPEPSIARRGAPGGGEAASLASDRDQHDRQVARGLEPMALKQQAVARVAAQAEQGRRAARTEFESALIVLQSLAPFAQSRFLVVTLRADLLDGTHAFV